MSGAQSAARRRFDDTNPAAEKAEFEDSIIDDLAKIGIKADAVSHTSDFFATFTEYAEKFIRQGDAFVDSTPVDEMRAVRGEGAPSACRNQSVERNLELWEEMKAGSDLGRQCVLRAKIDPNHL